MEPSTEVFTTSAITIVVPSQTSSVLITLHSNARGNSLIIGAFTKLDFVVDKFVFSNLFSI